MRTHTELIQSTRKSVSVADKATETLSTFISSLPPVKFDKPASVPPPRPPSIAEIKLITDLYLYYRRRGVDIQTAQELAYGLSKLVR